MKLHCEVKLKNIYVELDPQTNPGAVHEGANEVIKAVIKTLQRSVERNTASVHLDPQTSIVLLFVSTEDESTEDE